MAIQDDSPDHGVRIHLAAHDPEFPAKRDGALATLREAVNTVLIAHGFVAKPQSWVREGALGRAAAQIFPSRFGFEAEIRLSFLPSSGEPEGIWAEEGYLTLAAFDGPGAIVYLDVLERPDCLPMVIDALERRALPWLIAQVEGH